MMALSDQWSRGEPSHRKGQHLIPAFVVPRDENIFKSGYQGHIF